MANHAISQANPSAPVMMNTDCRPSASAIGGTTSGVTTAPTRLDGLGVLGNFTIVDSEATTPGDRLEGLALLGVSKYNYNAGLIYEKYGVSARIIYTYRSRYYDGDITNGLSLRPVSIPVGLNGIRAGGRLDFGLNYDLTDAITINLAGTNITGQKTYSFESREDFVRDVRNDDTTYSIGVRFNF